MERTQRRRGPELENVLLDAAWDELMATGYLGLTIEGVAVRARTGKQVLYRRWKSRADLVLAAIRHRTGSIVEDLPDDGNLRDDVLAAMRRMTGRFELLGPDVIHGLLAEAPTMDPEVFTRMSGVMRTIVDRAAARGEIPTADLPAQVLTAPINLLRHEMFLSRDAVAPATLTSLVDDIFLPLVTAQADRPHSPTSPAGPTSRGRTPDRGAV